MPEAKIEGGKSAEKVPILKQAEARILMQL
jgi:hypothetical protein